MTLPIDFALLGGTGNRLKSKTKPKLKEKQTSIAIVRDPLPTFAIFLAPLLSHYRLPLNYRLRARIFNLFNLDTAFNHTSAPSCPIFEGVLALNPHN
jgi:hypothetical protein